MGQARRKTPINRTGAPHCAVCRIYSTVESLDGRVFFDCRAAPRCAVCRAFYKARNPAPVGARQIVARGEVSETNGTLGYAAATSHDPRGDWFVGGFACIRVGRLTYLFVERRR